MRRVRHGAPRLAGRPLAGPKVTPPQLNLGAFHTCGVTAKGTPWCWGFNRYGQLGTSTNNNTDVGVYAPAVVDGGLTFATQ